ncbi:MAG TPA: hypothetical protein VGQ76_27820 [Thermoanaerobaculia bacterium]|jgi:hypothetical protein|nr:hypothetical protein [Thermoanaerobaculia bacterium]
MTESRRPWLILASIGCGLVLLALVAVALAILDKPHFKGMVGTWFLPIITCGVMVGALMVLIAAWKLPVGWRRRVLLLWSLIALTSPAFGIMFLFPWGLLVLSLPLVISILIGFSRAPATHVIAAER